MRSAIARVALFSLGILLMASSAWASGDVPTPEIDGSTLAVGLAGLSSAVLIMRARRRSN